MSTPDHQKRERVLEGHFACGAGLLIESECLGRTYTSRTSTRELTVSLPRMPADWQGDGLLDPPTWSYTTFRDPEHESVLSDGRFDWGLTSGFKNHADGSQSPEFARVRRWRFQTKMLTTSHNFDFFNARATTVREIEAWWDLVSSWISIFTKQDFVEIGKTRSGIRVGPVVTWCGGDDGLRVNGSRDTSIPVVNDEGVERVTAATMTRCMTLAASGTPPPDEWLFIRDARSLVNANQFRRAVIDACTSAELSLTALIDRKFTAEGTSAEERKKLFKTHHGISNLRTLHKNRGAAGNVPTRLIQDVGSLRNKAAHSGYAPTRDETLVAIDTAAALVEEAYPLTSYGIQPTP